MNARNIIIVAVLLILGSQSLFVVDKREQAILLWLGEITRSDFEPGLHVKVPFVQNVIKFERRLLTLDAEPERFLTSEKKDVIVDSYAKWRISEPEKFFRATRGDIRRANLLLYQKINNALRSEFGKRTVQEVVAGERTEIMDIVTSFTNNEAQELGMIVSDIRTKRIDLPAEVSDSVYNRMRAERERVARELRFRGAEAAEKIRADADRERAVILADAFREAETIRGEGDAESADIYAQAYNRNREFYSFYRSLQAYRGSLSNKSDMLLLDPESEFFKYFRNPQTR